MSLEGVKGTLAAGQVLTKNKKWLAKLLNQADVAAPQLAAALTEFRRSVEAVRDILLRLWYLAGEEPASREWRDTLVRIRDGHLQADVVTALGRSNRIGRIYDTYLNGWINKVVGDKKATEFLYLFNELRTSDSQVVQAIEELSREAQQVAIAAVDLIDQGRHVEAKEQLRNFAAVYHPHIRKINLLVAFMLKQENEFFDRAGLV